MDKVSCCDCGLAYSDFGLDTTIPDHQWKAITQDGCNILCASCIVKRASRLPGAIAMRAYIEIYTPPKEVEGDE